MAAKIRYNTKVNNAGATIDGKCTVENMNEIKQVINANATELEQLHDSITAVSNGLVYMGSVNPTTGLVFTPTQYANFKSTYPNQEPYWLGQGGNYSSSATGGFTYTSDVRETLIIVMKANAYSVTVQNKQLPYDGIVADDRLYIDAFGENLLFKNVVLGNTSTSDVRVAVDPTLSKGEINVYNYRATGNSYIEIFDTYVFGTTVVPGAEPLITNGVTTSLGSNTFRVQIKPKGMVKMVVSSGYIIIQGDLN